MAGVAQPGSVTAELDFHRLLEALPAAAYTCDPNGLITAYNQRAVQAWGREPRLNDPTDRYCGSFRMHTPGGDPVPHNECWMARCLKEGKEYNGEEIVVERPDGSRLVVLAHAIPFYNDDGKLGGAVNVVVDITQRKRTEQQLQESERALADFFENATLGLQWMDANGIVIRANRAQLELLGYPEAEYVGHHISEFHADRDLIEAMLARLSAGENVPEFEARLSCKDGSIKHVLINPSVLRNGPFVHTRCFTRDITDRKRAEQSLRESARRKDEFLAMLAHELRNPLAPIRNALQILRMDKSHGGFAPVHEMLERQVNQLVRLVDDLLDVSRITHDQIELRREPVELTTIVRAAVETANPLIASAGHELGVFLPSETLVFDADPVRLTQVLANLLNNAAKYTPEGGRIEILASRDGPDAVISVRDTGIGIHADMLPRVFELFMQGPRGYNRRQGGLGIGLTLTKRLVEMHGGTVMARSKGEGQGAEFVVRLPLKITDRPARAEPATGAPSRTMRRVLVVDDNRDAADSLGALLTLLGVDVTVVHDGFAALKALKTSRPTAVLLDIGMPDMDGYELARRMRQQPEGQDVRLIAVTGWGQAQDRERSRAAGIDHHVIKPVDCNVLMSLLSAGSPAQGGPAVRA